MATQFAKNSSLKLSETLNRTSSLTNLSAAVPEASTQERSILRRGWVGVRVEHCYNLGAPPGGGRGNNLNLTFKGSGSTQP